MRCLPSCALNRPCSFVAISGDKSEGGHASGAFDHFFTKPLGTSDLISVLESTRS